MASNLQSEIIEGYHVSAQQERLWLLQSASRSMAYRAQGAVIIDGPLHPDTLHVALGDLVKRHEILRTTFYCLAGMALPVQILNAADSSGSISWNVERGPSTAASPRTDALIEEILRATAQKQHDFEKGPLVHASLLVLNPDCHVLVLNLPALCADSATLKNIVRELGVNYARRRTEAILHEEENSEPMQYADFSAWQIELFDSEEPQAGRDYWRQNISPWTTRGLPFERQAAADSNRNGPQTPFAPLSFGLSLSNELSARVERVAAECECSLSTLLEACWQVLLWRLTEQAEIVVGTMYEGRAFDELKTALGLFAKFLPIHGRLDGETPFATLMKNTEAARIEVAKRQEYFRWDEIAGMSDKANGPQFFSYCFDYAEDDAPFIASNVTLTLIRENVCFDRYNVLLACRRSSNSLRTEFHYDSALFENASIELMSRQYEKLLSSVVDNPYAMLRDLDMVSDAERHKLLGEWNETERGYGTGSCLHELFERQVERTPGAVGVISATGEETSYAELNARANQLARLLLGRGVRVESRVALLLERSAAMVSSILGVLKAGGCYLPLDPEQPAERLRLMARDAQAELLLTDSGELAAVAAGWGIPVIRLDQSEELLAQQSESNPGVGVEPRNMAYAIYTSGSSGRPKAVAVEHRSICNRLLWMAEEFPLAASDRVLQKTAYSFDASIWELLLPLLSGAQVVLAKAGGQRDSGYLVEVLEQAEVTVLQMVPSMLAVLLSEPGFGERSGKLRRVFCGGEALSGELQARFYEELGARVELVNLYGPTEASIDASYRRCGPEDEHRGQVMIGRPIANMRLYVLDGEQQLLPVGVAGELYLGGAGVARGYLDRPELTAERFLPHPWSGAGGERLYRTGDLVRRLADGELEYLGRADQQVKIRGYRIELGEVEAALRRQPGVSEAVVLAPADAAGEKRLVAYVVAQPQEAGDKFHGKLYMLPNNLEIYHSNSGETDLLYHEIFEDQAYLKYGVNLSDGDCVFDVGANIGLFTLFVHSHCSNASVYAFEPIPNSFAILRRNIELFGLNVKTFEVGLSNHARRVEFTYYPQISTMSGLYADAEQDSAVNTAFLNNQVELKPYADQLGERKLEGVSVLCQLKTLSQVIRENGIDHIDLLKIDVEKSERDVLSGIEEEHWSRIRQIVVEVHDIEGRLREITELLERRGFEVKTDEDPLLRKTGLFNVYARRPGVRDKVPGVSNNNNGGLSSTGRPRPIVDELKRKLSEILPDYMIPTSIVVLEQLPHLTSGKVDRNALPALELAGQKPQPDHVAPRTQVEEVIAGIWATLLRVAEVGVADNFFDLGGHSLLATQLVSRVRKIFQVELPLRAFFESPTVAGVAENIQLLMQEEPCQQPPEIVPVPRTLQLPLSFAQQRLWFLDQLQPASAFYNLPAAIRLTGSLNLTALQESFDEIVRRHEALRTTFTSVDGRPILVIAPSLTVTLALQDLQSLSETRREAEALLLATEEVQKPFDLSTGPLFRVRVLQLGEREHILLLTIHHIISDGWSSAILVRELVALYEAHAKGKSAALPELPLQYADFAHWQRSWLQGEVLERQLDYWRRRLAGAPAALELPTDRLRPRVQTVRGGRQSLSLSAEMLAALKALSREEAVTLFMLLLAAFKVLLARYSGQVDIVVGTPIAGRNRVESENLIGFFVNTLVLRTDLSGNPTFQELLGRVRETALGAAAYQDLPFEKLVEELQPVRDLNRAPIFQVMFALQNATMDSYELEDLLLNPVEANTGTAKFDLELYFQETKDGLAGTFEYNSDLFDQSTIERMAQHYQILLQDIIANPRLRTQRLRMLTETECVQQLEAGGESEAGWSLEQSFAELFSEQVEATPEAVAVVSEGVELSYRELNERANQVAQLLRAAGVGAETVVGLLGERSAGLLIGILGVFKAGAAYMPLDPGQPAARQRQMVEQSGTRLVLASGEYGGELRRALALGAEAGPEIRELEEAWEAGSGWSKAAVEQGSEPEQLAYVIYTSGSTGAPKGAMITQRGMVNHLQAKVAGLGLTGADRVAQTASQSFDISVWQFLGALLVGGQVEIVSREVEVDPRALLRLVAERGVTVMETVPSLLGALLEELEVGGESGGGEGEQLGGLRWLIATGEALAPELCRRWAAVSGATRLLNAYGPTECADDVTHYEVVGAPAAAEVRMPIGRALGNTQLYVLNEELGLLPRGVVGELYVGGAGVGRGYLRDARRTAQSFGPDPYSRTAGARLYQTGDLARYRADGELEYVGRRDQQVKVRGYRIELGEIEAVLRGHEEVQAAVVEARADERGEQRLVGYVVREAGGDGQAAAGVSELRAYLRERLPEYMVPPALVILAQIPLTPNGKIDRKALPSPDFTDAGLERALIAPRNETEKTLASIWSEVLGVQDISIEDNFFNIGGHSLLATQVVSRLRQRLAIEIPLRTLFESPTIASLAVAIANSQSEQTQPEISAIKKRPRATQVVNELLVKVQHLSEDEARRLLDQMKNANAG